MPTAQLPVRPDPRRPSALGWRLALTTAGIARIPDLPASAVAACNDALDPLFAPRRAESRSYVDAGRLAATGVLERCLTPEVRAVIAATVSRPVLYHCHAYEIAGGAERPHIRAGRLEGWHRDDETVAGNDRGRPKYLSLFVYLSDVGDDGGAFELVARRPRWGLLPDDPVVRAVGPAGMSFVWNRTYFHRASPNRSPKRRRLVKLSWQSGAEPNDRIGLREFSEARDVVGGRDPFLAALLGLPGSYGSSDPPLPTPSVMLVGGPGGFSRSVSVATHVHALQRAVSR